MVSIRHKLQVILLPPRLGVSRTQVSQCTQGATRYPYVSTTFVSGTGAPQVHLRGLPGQYLETTLYNFSESQR